MHLVHNKSGQAPLAVQILVSSGVTLWNFVDLLLVPFQYNT
jgi:hypothetical protein